jgi:hypothetical protein
MARYAKYGSGKEIDMWRPELYTRIDGKFRYTVIKGDDWTVADLDAYIGIRHPELIRRGCANPNNSHFVPFHQNKLIMAAHNDIISPYYMGNYTDFLKTKQWRKLRDFVMDLWEYRCIVCKKRKAIDVHHRTYQFGWLPEFEATPPYPLWPLCRVCHMIEHIDELVRFAK